MTIESMSNSNHQVAFFFLAPFPFLGPFPFFALISELQIYSDPVETSQSAGGSASAEGTAISLTYELNILMSPEYLKMEIHKLHDMNWKKHSGRTGYSLDRLLLKLEGPLQSLEHSSYF